MKLLIVDDDIFLRDMYATKFIEHGHDVVTASNAADALHVFENGDVFDIMLVDMIIPGMTGVELIQKIHIVLPETKMKSIVLFNQYQGKEIAEATAAGADGHIIKAQTVPGEVVSQVEMIMSEK